MNNKPKYSTWIRRKKIILFWFITLSLLFGGCLFGFYYKPLYSLSLFALPFLYISIIISITAIYFSPKGKDYQNKIHQLMIASLKRNHGVLDIGCGNGNLIIKLAKNNKVQNYGIDYWGADWEYSKKQCEFNAQLEGTNNITFKKASASSLPFKTSSLDNVISCLTFHEVKDTPDKTKLLKEALRVLKPEGTFTFLDLFDDKKYYPDSDKIRKAITASGGKILKYEKLIKMISLPYPLNKKQVLKNAVLIAGKKKLN